MKVVVEETGIVPIVEEELEEFGEQVRRFRAGENDPTAFQIYRLREGTYGQRQPDRQMMRIKIPGGILTAKQLETLGEVAARYAALDKGHITTRENVQYHHVTLEDAVEVKWLIAKVGLTTREACGNTVRNAVTCPLAGICRRELFDVTPYLAAYVRYFIRKPFTHNMPRKWKTSFSPCATDCASAPFHDLGFVAEVREIDGVQRRGFRIHVGGGSSIMPRMAPVLYDFVPVEEYLRVSEAALRIFNRTDELRKNRMMARIKVLIDRIGIDKFRAMVEEELKEPWAQQPINPEDYMPKAHEKTLPPYQFGNGHAPAEENDAEFLRWKMSNTEAQRQGGYYAVYVNVPQGDVSSAQMKALAELSREFGNATVRTDVDQNLVLRWVRRDRLFQLWQALQGTGLADPGVHEITDVTSCPGTDSCKLGITSSMAANRAVRSTLLDMNIEDPLVKAMHVKLSGCPNGCGRHHLGSIGFQGASVKGEGTQQVPAYEVYIGGRYLGGEFRYAKRVSTKIPSKRLPEAVRLLLGYYTENRQTDESFDDFVDRVGHSAFEPVLAPLKGVGPVAENLELYEDWERPGLYKLERGEGECAV